MRLLVGTREINIACAFWPKFSMLRSTNVRSPAVGVTTRDTRLDSYGLLYPRRRGRFDARAPSSGKPGTRRSKHPPTTGRERLLQERSVSGRTINTSAGASFTIYFETVPSNCSATLSAPVEPITINPISFSAA